LLGDSVGSFQILCPHCGCQAVFTVVGQMHGLFFGVERDQGRDRTEHFLGGGPCAVLQACPQSRFDPCAPGELFSQVRDPTTEQDLGPFLFCKGVVGEHLVAVLGGDQRSHGRLCVGGASRAQLSSPLCEPCRDLVEDRTLDVDSL